MNENTNILLVYRTGNTFSMEDVYLLADHLHSKNKQITVYCLTNAIKQRINMLNVNLIPLFYEWPNWWAKMNLFAPELENLRPFLYMDLDTAVIKPIAYILQTIRQYNGVIMLRDFYRLKTAASGLMWLPANNEKIKEVWKNWIKNPELNIRNFRGDQEFINSIIIPDSYWQDLYGGIVSYKPNKIKRKVLDGTEKIVCFHGVPKIREAAKSAKWVNEYIKINHYGI